MKGNFHARFGIGGGEGDLSADHTKTNVKDWLRSLNSLFALFTSMNKRRISGERVKPVLIKEEYQRLILKR